jgi:putative glutamine amidotransferase
MQRRPIIGISGNIFPATDRKFYKNKELLVVERSMANAILAVGGAPILLPVSTDGDVLDTIVHKLDGLLLSGGTDVDPSSYGQPNSDWPGQPERDRCELGLLQRMRAQKRPVLGICRGHQVLNVGFGGTLLQDIVTQRPTCHIHRSQEKYDALRHPIRFLPNTLLASLFDGMENVNSVHHQAIDRLGEGLEAAAWSDDDLIEAVWAPEDHWTWGIQWHPEWDLRAAEASLFTCFVRKAGTE